MPQVSGDTIIWDYNDWLSGLNKQYVSGLTDVPIPIAGPGLSSASRFNPYRYFGYASPGFDATDVTNASEVDNVLLNIALSNESSTNYGYLIENGSQLHRLDIANKTISSGGSWPHAITGVGTITGSDVIAYTANVGGTSTPCIFYSWNDSGGSWNVGRFRTDTGAFDDDFMSTVPATPLVPSGNNKPHAMWVGANDILYIWDGNRLHAYDGATGTDGTFSSAVMTIPNGYIGTSFAMYDDGAPYLVCYAYYSPSGNSVSVNTTTSGIAMAYFYDYLSLDPVRVVPLNDRVVTAGFSWKGTIGCFTQGNNLVNDGANRFTRLKVWNGAEFETVVTQIGNAPVHGGVDIVGDSIQWASGGATYAFGSPFEGMDAKFNTLAAGGGTSNGVIRTIGGSTGFQLLSTGTTTSGGLEYMKAATFAANATVTGSPALPVFSKGMTGKVRYVRVEFAKTSSDGRALNLFLTYDNSASSTILSGLEDVTATNLTYEYYNDSSGAPLPVFNEIRPIFQWQGGTDESDAPVVKRVVVRFEEVNIEGTH